MAATSDPHGRADAPLIVHDILSTLQIIPFRFTGQGYCSGNLEKQATPQHH